MSTSCFEEALLSQIPGLNWFYWKLPKIKILFYKRLCLKIQADLSRLLGWGWMFPCQTCNQLVSFCKKLITASANRRRPKSSEVLSSQKKNDKNIYFFFKWCACILFSLFRCGTGRGRDGLKKIVGGKVREEMMTLKPSSKVWKLWSPMSQL